MHAPDDPLRWKERSRQLVTSCFLFDVYASERTSGGGKTGVFSVLEARDWVTVVPVLRMPGRDDAFLMVRQYRHGADLITTEFPAGIVEPGEDPAGAAIRELAEETGYRAGRMRSLGRTLPNPAFMNNWCSIFLAEDLTRAGGLSLDETEDLEVLEMPLSTVREGIGTGELVNTQTIVALLLYERVRAVGA